MQVARLQRGAGRELEKEEEIKKERDTGARTKLAIVLLSLKAAVVVLVEQLSSVIPVRALVLPSWRALIDSTAFARVPRTLTSPSLHGLHPRALPPGAALPRR